MSTEQQSAENDAPPLASGARWSYTWPRTRVYPEPGYVISPATTETTPTPAAPSRRAEVNGAGE